MTFKELLKDRRWNCSTLAKKFGVHPQTVLSWCQKKSSPSPKRIKEIAEILECTTDEVINALLA